MINFRSSVVGGTILVRDAIQSSNYVTTVSGWTLNNDGTAEFGEATIRGRLIVTGTGDSYIRVDSFGGIPTIALQPDWSGLSEELFFGSIVSSKDIGLDEGSIFFYGPAFAGQTRARIEWKASTSLDCSLILDGATLLNLIGDSIHMDGPTDLQGSFTASGLITASGNLQVNGNVQGDLDVTGDITRNGGELLPMTRLGGANSTVSTAAIAAATETVVLTSGSIVFPANSAFKAVSWARYVNSAASGPVPRFRKTNLAGQQLADNGRWDVTSTSTCGRYVESIFITSSQVTAAIAMTLESNVGTITQAAAANNPRAFDVYYLGPASDYPNRTTLV